MIKKYLLVFIPISVIIAFFMLYLYNTEKKNHLESYKLKEKSIVNKKLQDINNLFNFINSDLNSLKKLYERELNKRQGFFDSALISDIFKSFSQSKAIYDQIRYINKDGKETLRINLIDGKAHRVETNHLQNKSSCYYFIETMKLNRGQIYISPFDLNVEKGKIEKPLKPVIRFASVVYGPNNKKDGIVIINYLGEHLISHFNNLTSSNNAEYYLFNSNSYWLINDSKKHEWAFMFKEQKDKSLIKLDPELWNVINQNDSGQFIYKHGLYTYKSIYPLSSSLLINNKLNTKPANKDYYWKIVSHLPLKELDIHMQESKSFYLKLYFLILILSGLASYYIAKKIKELDLSKKALQDSEQKYRNLFNQAEDSIFIVDSGSGIILDCNDEAYKQLQYTKEELLSLSVFDINKKEFYPIIRKTLNNTNEQSYRLELDHVKKDKTEIPVEVHAQIIDYYNKKVFLAFARDISERKKAEKMIQKQNKDLINILESISQPFFVVDVRDFSIVLANSAAKTMNDNDTVSCFALTEGKTEPCNVKNHQCPIEVIKKTKSPARITHKHLDKFGNAKYTEVYAYPIYDDSGELIQVVENFIDITDRKKVEMALRQSEMHFRTLTSLAPIGIYLTNPEGYCHFVNEKWCELTGLALEDALGNGWEKVVHPEDREFVNKAWTELINNLTPFNLEYRFLKDSGEIIWIYGMAAPLFDLGNKTIGFVGVNLDISKRKEMEEQIKSINKELETRVKKRTHELTISNERLEVAAIQLQKANYKLQNLIEKEKELSHLKDDFITNINHELKTPLTSILMVTNYLEKHNSNISPEKLNQKISRLKESSTYLLEIITEILEFSNIENNSAASYIRKVSLNEIFTIIENHFKDQFINKAIGFDLELKEDIRFHIDMNHLIKIIKQLVSNSLKFTEKGEVQLSALQEDSKVKITIKDTGIGIEKEFQEKAFNKFTQGEIEGTKAPGIGIGLYIVKLLTDKHGGEIKLSSELEKGTEITLLLPEVSNWKAEE